MIGYQIIEKYFSGWNPNLRYTYDDIYNNQMKIFVILTNHAFLTVFNYFPLFIQHAFYFTTSDTQYPHLEDNKIQLWNRTNNLIKNTFFRCGIWKFTAVKLLQLDIPL